MLDRPFEIAVVTDEVSLSLEEALRLGGAWGITRFELREGIEGRFPFFTDEEIGLVEEQLRGGARVTAVSPGILKGSIQDLERLRYELEHVLPRSMELGARFESPLLIVFGFERADGESDRLRLDVMRTFERVAEEAVAAGMAVAVENEPNFWIDEARETAAMLEEIGHPSLKVNWDPANAHWGGRLPDYGDFTALRPYLANVHIKDYSPADPRAPWKPIGQGETPWPEYLEWIVRETDLEHATLETHCTPLEESSKESLDYLHEILTQVEEGR